MPYIIPDVGGFDARGRGVDKGIWVWGASYVATNPDTFIQNIVRGNFTEVYVTYDLGTASVAQYQYVISQLWKYQIEVHALTGDPTWCLTIGKQNGLDYIDSIGRYNAQSPYESRFRAVHFDNEPNGLNGGVGVGGHNEWNNDRVNLYRQWIANTREWIARARWHQVALGAAFPYWLSEESAPPELGASTKMSTLMIDAYDYYAIMAYNNDKTQAVSISQQELDYADLPPGPNISQSGTTTQQIYQSIVYLPPWWFQTSPTITSGGAVMANADITSKVNELATYGVTGCFCDCGQVDATGNLPAAGYGSLANFLSVARAAQPNIKFYPIINEANGTLAKTSDLTYRANFKASINALFGTGSPDGIHIDWEPTAQIMSGPQSFLDCLNDWKSVLPAGTHFSLDGSANYVMNSGVGSPTPAQMDADPTIFNSTQEWKTAWITRVANIVTMICPMMYDRMWTNGEVIGDADYQDYWYRATMYYANAINASQNKSCQLLPIFPAYKDSASHKQATEQIHNAMIGLNKAISAMKNQGLPGIYGIGLFWWSGFIGLESPGDTHDYSVDRGYWNNEWKPLTTQTIPQVLSTFVTGQNLKKIRLGIETTNQTPAWITFYGLGFQAAEDGLLYMHNQCKNLPGYGGLAVHDYSQYLIWLKPYIV